MSPEREVFLAVCLFLCVYYGGVQAPACSSAGVPDMSNPGALTSVLPSCRFIPTLASLFKSPASGVR